MPARNAIWVLVLAHALLASGAFVVCARNGGCVTLKLTLAQCCANEPFAPVGAPVPATSPETDDCGCCDDGRVADDLLGAPADFAGRPHSERVVLTLASPTLETASFGGGLGSTRPPAAVRAFSQWLSHGSTVVLRC